MQTAAHLNKNSFRQHSHATHFCIKTNLRENRLFAAGGRLVDEEGTHNVKFLTKNYTKTILSRTRVRATAWKAPRLQPSCDDFLNTLHRQRNGKHVRLQPPARTAARYATHAQRRQHHANAEAICHLQLVFWLVKNALNAFCLVVFSET